jgi:hypothetical protein
MTNSIAFRKVAHSPNDPERGQGPQVQKVVQAACRGVLVSKPSSQSRWCTRYQVPRVIGGGRKRDRLRVKALIGQQDCAICEPTVGQIASSLPERTRPPFGRWSALRLPLSVAALAGCRARRQRTVTARGKPAAQGW